MPPMTIETQLFTVLKRLADELDQIDTRLMELIEAIREPVRVLPATQSDLLQWSTE